MESSVLRRLAAAAALAAAAPLAWADSPPASCGPLPGAGTDPMSQRAELLAEYRQLPQACLQDIFKVCAQAADHALLDFGSAAVCSFGYEALLSQRFHGNFRALMAWWQDQRTASAR